MPFWSALVVALAGAKIAVGTTLYLSGVLTATASGKLPMWFYATLAATFGVLGGVVLAGHQRDERAAWWGGSLVLIGSAFAPLVSVVPHPAVMWIAVLRPDAFNAPFIWKFVSVFPTRATGKLAEFANAIAMLALVVATWCFVANAMSMFDGLSAEPWIGFGQIRPGQPSLYWPLIFGLVLPAALLLVWRGSFETPYPGSRLFVRGLLIGVAPIAIEVLLEELIPAYKTFVRQPHIDPWIAVLLFGSLFVVPFVTLYSILFDRVLEMRWVLRSALQYLLARYTIVGLTLMPFAALVFYLISHRDEPMASLAIGPRPLLLGATVVAGFAALRLRHRWLEIVDRRYFREPYDPQQVLSHFVASFNPVTPAELADSIQLQVARALHADVEVFFIDDSRGSLRHAGRILPSLPVTSTLVRLALNDTSPMDVNLNDRSSPLQRLTAEERAWIARGPFCLIVAMRRNDAPIGLLALTAKQSGLAYSPIDRRLLSSVAAAAALIFENLQLKSTPDSPLEQPAKECVECSRMNPSDTPRCSCGGAVREAAAPYMLRNVFRLERRIGSGGMGVVYKAVDLNLGRDVAVKTLPVVTEAHVARLRKEARAMATVSHPHLAVIHGIEMWRGVPYLIEEYLAGGTLANRLNASRLDVPDALDVGIAMCDAFEHLHAAGVLHCDVKPSNIGFTQTGTAKLLDFGLARLLSAATDETASAAHPHPRDRPGMESASAIRGTPFYMAPEAVGGKRATAGFDLWALSVVIFECLSGQRPFQGRDTHEIFISICATRRPDLRQAMPDAPDDVARFVNSLFALDASKRPASATLLRHELNQLRSQQR